jgi:hypothetical protein
MTSPAKKAKPLQICKFLNEGAPLELCFNLDVLLGY